MVGCAARAEALAVRRIIPSVVVFVFSGVALAAAAAGPARAEGDAVRYRPGPAAMSAGGRPRVGLPPVRAGRRPRPVRPAVRRTSRAHRGPRHVRARAAAPHAARDVVPTRSGCGRSSVRAQFHWSNSFGWRQDVTGEDPGMRYFLVDGETRTVDATFLHGVTADLDLGVRVPYHWRGPGVLDEVIDVFHSTIPGALPGQQARRLRQRPVPRARPPRGRLPTATFDADDDTGARARQRRGHRPLALRRRRARRAVAGARRRAPRRRPAARRSTPTASRRGCRWSRPTASRRAGTCTAASARPGTRSRPTRASGTPSGGRRCSSPSSGASRPWASLLLQLDYTGPLAADVANFAPDVFYTQVGVKMDLAPGTRVEVGFTENIDQPADHRRLRDVDRRRAHVVTLPRDAGRSP